MEKINGQKRFLGKISPSSVEQFLRLLTILPSWGMIFYMVNGGANAAFEGELTAAGAIVMITINHGCYVQE